MRAVAWNLPVFDTIPDTHHLLDTACAAPSDFGLKNSGLVSTLACQQTVTTSLLNDAVRPGEQRLAMGPPTAPNTAR